MSLVRVLNKYRWSSSETTRLMNSVQKKSVGSQTQSECTAQVVFDEFSLIALVEKSKNVQVMVHIRLSLFKLIASPDK